MPPAAVTITSGMAGKLGRVPGRRARRRRSARTGTGLAVQPARRTRRRGGREPAGTRATDEAPRPRRRRGRRQHGQHAHRPVTMSGLNAGIDPRRTANPHAAVGGPPARRRSLHARPRRDSCLACPGRSMTWRCWCSPPRCGGVAMTGTKFAIGGFGPLTLLAVELVAATVALWIALLVRGYQRPRHGGGSRSRPARARRRLPRRDRRAGSYECVERGRTLGFESIFVVVLAASSCANVPSPE